MRIISGKYKGRKLKGFDIDGTRPTMDRVKESLFGMIQDYIPTSSCLDLFAGSGALGIEALSEGAKKCVFIDNNIVAINVIKENTKDIDGISIKHIDYKKYLKTTDEKFDIIFLDPPYKSKQLGKALEIIEKRNLLNSNGIIVCECENDFVFNMKTIKEKKYGNKCIKILKNT